jgi:hypothetical protein
MDSTQQPFSGPRNSGVEISYYRKSFGIKAAESPALPTIFSMSYGWHPAATQHILGE